MLKSRDEHILIMGSGGIGGTIAARLAKKGLAVTVVTRNPEIAQKINADGLLAQYDNTSHVVPITAAATTAQLGPDPEPRYTLCVVAVPPSSAEQAVRDALPWMQEDASFLCCPNGLVEERLEAILDPARIVGGVVTFSGSMLGPGHVEQTSPGGIMLGCLPAATANQDAAIERVSHLFQGCLPIHRTQNLRGARWSKLALNCGVSALGTVGGDTLGILMRQRIVRRLMLEVITEVVEVAHAEEVELVKVAGALNLNWLSLGQRERRRRASTQLFTKHTILLLAGTPYRNMRSSMLRALERGRRPPVDYLNGEITARAQKLGMHTPVNAALQQTINALADGHGKPGTPLLREVYASTRTR